MVCETTHARVPETQLTIATIGISGTGVNKVLVLAHPRPQGRPVCTSAGVAVRTDVVWTREGSTGIIEIWAFEVGASYVWLESVWQSSQSNRMNAG